MQTRFKKCLLTGTAVITVGAFSSAAQAQATHTLDANSIWADTGEVENAAAGDNVNIDGYQLTITNNGTADDGSGFNEFSIGAITGAGQDSVVVIAADAAAALTVTIDSVNIGGEFDLTGNDAAGFLTTVVIQNNFEAGETVTITGGEGAGSNAVLQLFGNATFGNGLDLADDGGRAVLDITGTGHQVVNGTINGSAFGNGTIDIYDKGGSSVTFTDQIGGTHSLNEIAVDGAVVIFEQSVDVGSVLVNQGDVTFNEQLWGDVVFRDDHGTVTLNDDMSGNVYFEGNDATLVLDGNITLLGYIDNNDGGGDAYGTVEITGTGTAVLISGQVGRTDGIAALNVSGSGNLIGLVDANAAVIERITIDGNENGFTLAGGLEGDLEFAGTENTVTIYENRDLDGNIIVTNGDNTLTLNGNNTVTGNISGAESLSLVNVNGNATFTGETLNVDTLSINGAHTVTFDYTGGARLTFTGDVTVEEGGIGAINMESNVDIFGNIGTENARIGDIVIDNNVMFWMHGDVWADRIEMRGPSSLDFSHGGTIAGDIIDINHLAAIYFHGAADVLGTVGSENDPLHQLSFDGYDAGEHTIAFYDDVFVTSAIFGGLNGSERRVLLATPEQVFSVSGNVTVGVHNTIAFTVGRDEHGVLTSGILDVSGNANLENGNTEIVLGQGTGYIADGETFQIVRATGTITPSVHNIGTFNRFLSYETEVDGHDLNVIMTRTSTFDSVATTPNTSRIGQILESLGSDATGELAAIQDRLFLTTTDAEAEEILQSILPSVDGGHVVAAQNISTNSMNLTGQRIAQIRGGETGMAAGNVTRNLHMWGQVFGQHIDQDTRGGIAGYDARTWGATFGIDSGAALPGAVVGAAFTYGDTRVKSDGVNNTRTDVDSYQLSLYGSMDVAPATYVNGMAAYAWNDVDTARYNVGMGNDTARGSFDAHQFTARAEIGHNIRQGQMLLTPNAMAHWMHYDAESYTETGAGGANLTVNQDSLNLFELGLGLNASWDIVNADGSILVPELRVGYRYDLIGDEVQTTSQFTGGGAAFTTEGFTPARSTFNVGAGVKFHTVQNWDFTANYDFEVKSDYQAHSGFLRAGYRF